MTLFRITSPSTEGLCEKNHGHPYLSLATTKFSTAACKTHTKQTPPDFLINTLLTMDSMAKIAASPHFFAAIPGKS
jgi:hypothetical protein